MQLLLNCKARSYCEGRKLLNRKTLLAMKMLCILLTVASLQIAARGYSQGISITLKNEPLEKLFNAVEQQTNFSFVYSKEAIEQSKPVTIEVKNENLENVLKTVFANQPLTYSFNEKFIVIKLLNQKKEIVVTFIDVRGRVVNENGEPIVGASIVIKGTTIGTSTNSNGEFILNVPSPDMILVVTSVNTEPFEVRINGRTDLGQISINTSVKVLDAVIINKGYYSTSQKLNTGNVSKVTAETISMQPVSNPLAALQGRVPGLVVTQNTGVPGGGFTVRIRGQNSIKAGNDVLYVIDGVPFISLSLTSATLSYSIIGQGSPLNSINPSDIESIEILKDADASAIYGSRGANGVVLITTKKGKAGDTKFDFNVYTGMGKVTRKLDMLNTQQYLQMRHEAFNNDGVNPDPTIDYDLTAWDTTRYTNWGQVLIGGTAHFINAQTSISGGNINTQFLIGAGYHKETTVFPGDFSDQKGSIHFNLNHATNNQKFKIAFAANYLVDNNNLFSYDITGYLNLPPNTPEIYDANGKLNWENGTFNNPFSIFLQKYKSNTHNLIANSILSYRILPNLQLKTRLGYGRMQVNEKQINPLSSFNPSYGYTSADVNSLFADNSNETWIIEPQTDYTCYLLKGNLTVLAGATFQEDIRQGQTINGMGFSSESLMENLAAASSVTILSTNYIQYRYNAIFGRINYAWQNKYLLNLTARRDGSSRFGPEKQFGNFGAVGLGWVFSNEAFIQKGLPFVSFGKLRASYGTTGNDQIGDYQYLSTWSSTSLPYQGSMGLRPTRLLNPDYGWEVNKKFEAALEFGILKDRILFSGSYYRNRSSNQLVGYPLAPNTGFTSIQYNLPATVENTGFEFELITENVKTNNIKWITNFNISIPRNKLISYPNLEGSSYANTYLVGQSLYLIKAFHFINVDPQNGIYQFEDINKDGNPTPKYPGDLAAYKKIAQSFYGGLQNSLNYKNFQFDLFFQFVKQTGRNYIYWFLPPGVYVNQPTDVLTRWQKPGDVTNVQKFTQDWGSDAANAFFNSQLADNSISDASFIRLKNLSLSYQLPNNWKQKMKLANCRIYLQGQNLFTITNYLGMDPETQSFVLPPLRVLTVGIQLTF